MYSTRACSACSAFPSSSPLTSANRRSCSASTSGMPILKPWRHSTMKLAGRFIAGRDRCASASAGGQDGDQGADGRPGGDGLPGVLVHVTIGGAAGGGGAVDGRAFQPQDGLLCRGEAALQAP